MIALPIDDALPGLLRLLRDRRNLVVVAEPGAGKTTRVAPAIATSGLLAQPGVVMLQPRRVAARAAAERIAEERRWQVGEQVGYQVRFERRVGPDTRVRVLTEAILARQLLSDPLLGGVGCVILDEFHERSIHSDLALALVREVQESLRPDLRIVVMSATLDAAPVAAFLGEGTEVLQVPGRGHPVRIEHRDRRGVPWDELLEREVIAAAGSARDGHILVFLPGAEEIRRAQRALQPRVPGWQVVPLHGSLPFDEQRRAILPSPTPRIILATNIAETSLTIDGVTTVIDSGLSRQTRFNPSRGLERLELGRISQASATQRAGRAGRTRPGRCVRLWSVKEHQELAPFDAPELRRTDLAPTLLTLAAWGVGDPMRFAWFEAPEPAAVEHARNLLQALDAIDSTGKVTDVGRRMAELPLHPRLARLLLGAVDAGQPEQGAAAAAILAERDFRVRDTALRYTDRQPAEVTPSDLHTRIDLLGYARARGFHGSLEDEGIDPVAARQVDRTREELLRRAGRPARVRETGGDWLLRAFPDRVCVRREGDGATALMVGDVGVRLAPESGVRRGVLFLALDLRDDDRQDRRQAEVTLAHAIEETQLARTFPSSVTTQRTCTYDPDKDKVVGRVRRSYRGLTLDTRDDGPVDDVQAAGVLAERLLADLPRRIEQDEEASRLWARIRLAREFVAPPPGLSWPGDDWTHPTEAVAEQVRAAVMGKRRLAEVELAAVLRALLPWPLDRLLDEHVPERWQVPTGNRIRIDYTSRPPVLAVRLQELFGTTCTPAVCGGRVPLLLHLLSPGYKPVQVTQDLVSFWRTTYAQVRRDLRARYPKHAWPEDPLSAAPVAKGRPSR